MSGRDTGHRDAATGSSVQRLLRSRGRVRHRWLIASTLALGVISEPAWAAIVVDGILSDWDVFPAAYSAGPAQWTPNAGITFIQEDQNPAISFLGPGFGGQAFDIEALYFTTEGPTAFFAVVSGAPLSGTGIQAPGDFAIDFGSNGSYDFGVKTVGTHTLYGNTVWNVPNLWPSSAPYRIVSGTPAGVAQFGYQPSAYVANSHYAFEIGVPISLFGSSWPTSGTLDMTLHWTTACGNDELDLRVIRHIPPPPPPPPPVIPEPMTSLLWGLGMLGPLSRGLSARRRVRCLRGS